MISEVVVMDVEFGITKSDIELCASTVERGSISQPFLVAHCSMNNLVFCTPHFKFFTRSDQKICKLCPFDDYR